MPEHESIVSPGSACASCGRALRWRENIPIVSWVVQRGRCAHCGARVSIRYPALEAGTAAAFAAIVAVRGVEPWLALALPFAAVLIVIAVVDLERRLVPNPIVLTAALYAIPAWLVVDPGALPEVLAAGAGAFTAFLLIALAYPAGMGMGDVKLAGVMGLYLGLEVIPVPARRLPHGVDRGCGHDRAWRHGRAQEGRPFRAVPGPGRPGGPPGGPGADRSVRRSLPLIAPFRALQP